MEDQKEETAAAPAPDRGRWADGHADSAVRIGAAHHRECSPCQDYASSSGADAPYPFAVVSDGCGSGSDTDLAARAIVASAHGFLEDEAMTFDGAFGGLVPVGRLLFPGSLPALLGRIQDALGGSGLTGANALATLGIARSYAGGCSAHLIGDGAIVRYGRDSIEVTLATWAGNMPLYPAYLWTAEAREQFCRESEEHARQTGRAALTVETRLCRAGEGWSDCFASESFYGAEEAIYGLHRHFVDGDDVEVLAVMTDGVTRVGTVEPWPVCASLAAVGRAREGSFARRRMNGAMATFLAGGALPGDDLAVAAIARRIPGAG